MYEGLPASHPEILKEVPSRHLSHQSLKAMWCHVPRKNMEKILPSPRSHRDLEGEEKGTVVPVAPGEEAESLAERQKWWAAQALLSQPRGQVGRAMLAGLTANMGAPQGKSSAMEGGWGEHPPEKKCCHPPIPRAQLQQRHAAGDWSRSKQTKARDTSAPRPTAGSFRAVCSLSPPPSSLTSEKTHFDERRGGE